MSRSELIEANGDGEALGRFSGGSGNCVYE